MAKSLIINLKRKGNGRKILELKINQGKYILKYNID
jgi:hypothetical protein